MTATYQYNEARLDNDRVNKVPQLKHMSVADLICYMPYGLATEVCACSDGEFRVRNICCQIIVDPLFNLCLFLLHYHILHGLLRGLLVDLFEGLISTLYIFGISSFSRSSVINSETLACPQYLALNFAQLYFLSQRP